MRLYFMGPLACLDSHQAQDLCDPFVIALVPLDRSSSSCESN